MKKEKVEFDLNNYLFQIVKMNVFNSDGRIDLAYLLLIDQDFFIHDYKIKVNNTFCIKTKTTTSHKESKKNNLALLRRIEIIDHLGLKHEFGDGKKEITYINDERKILNLNKWLYEQNWRDITFQNIEYIIEASNPSGGGKGNNTFKTKINGTEYPFGFLFECLNISKKIKNIYKNVNYQKKWEEFKQSDFKDYLEFEKFINNTFLEIYLKKFKHLSGNYQWKDHKKDLENELNKRRNSFILIEKEVSKRRNEFKTNIDKLNKNSEKEKLVQFLYKNYFNINEKECDSKYEKAHIKPVWLIKSEYVLSDPKDIKILDQISDAHNFLPLSKIVHDLYDDKYLYWDTGGNLIKIKNPKMHEISNFLKINRNKLNNFTVWYLNEYIEKVVKKLPYYKNI